MNKKQKIVLKTATAIMVVMLLWPPFQTKLSEGRIRNDGYDYIFSPPSSGSSVDIGLLFAQLTGVVIVSVLAFFLNKDQKESVDSVKKENELPADNAIKEAPNSPGVQVVDKVKQSPPRDTQTDKSTHYEQALTELETNSLVKSTWAMAYSEADGEENKAKARYIRMRVDQLDQEEQDRQVTEAAVQKEREFTDKALREKKEKENTPKLGIFVSSKAYQLASELQNELQSLQVYDLDKAKDLIVALGGEPYVKQGFWEYLCNGGVKTRLNDKEYRFPFSDEFPKWVYTEITPKVIAEYEASQEDAS